MARGLVERRTRLFGVDDLRPPQPVFQLGGLRVSRIGRDELGYQVLFNTGDRDPALEERAIESLLELRVDGLILASPRVDDTVVARAAAAVPVVVLNRETSDDATDSVTNDNITGARLAVEHLVELGHRRIAFISGGQGSGARIRAEGYRLAMVELGLADHIQIAEGAHTEDGGERGAREILTTRPLPTAIFASNDLCAIGAMNALEEAGIRIPERHFADRLRQHHPGRAAPHLVVEHPPAGPRHGSVGGGPSVRTSGRRAHGLPSRCRRSRSGGAVDHRAASSTGHT